MQNLGTIWVVINATEAQSRLIEFIDGGSLAEAVGFSSALSSMIEKMKLFTQQYGGSIPIALYERMVMQLPSSAVEQLPSIIKGYSEALNNKIAVGIGLTMEEASKSAQKSIHSGEIELYDPEDNYDYEESIEKGGMSTRRWKSGVVLPPNIFDPTVPDEAQYKQVVEQANIKLPSLEEQMQGETKIIQAIVGQMGMEQVQQQMQQMQEQQAQAEAQQPGDLLESLNGGPVDGHTPEEEEGQEDAPKNDSEASEGQSSDQEGQEAALAEEVEEAQDSTSDDKIAMQLDQIKGQIPQIMGLAQKDPKAFKQTMNMINKLIQLAHNRSKTTKKSETRDHLEQLIKDINMRAASRPKTGGHQFPVGTRMGKYKKVLVDGMEKWREMSSGVLLDSKGNAISVKENNKQRDDNQREEEDNHDESTGL